MLDHGCAPTTSTSSCPRLTHCAATGGAARFLAADGAAPGARTIEHRVFRDLPELLRARRSAGRQRHARDGRATLRDGAPDTGGRRGGAAGSSAHAIRAGRRSSVRRERRCPGRDVRLRHTEGEICGHGRGRRERTWWSWSSSGRSTPRVRAGRTAAAIHQGVPRRPRALPDGLRPRGAQCRRPDRRSALHAGAARPVGRRWDRAGERDARGRARDVQAGDRR